MKQTKNLLLALIAASAAAGCFAHREAPRREVAARSVAEAEAMAARVERVDLSGEALSAVPASLASMPKLRTLCLAGTGVTNFSALKSLPALEVLDLGRVRMEVAPEELASLHALRDLYLGGCGLGLFPAVVAPLPALRYLNLDRNRIRALPPALPAGLRWLRLNDNELEALPDSIGRLAALERIYLRGNRLSSLPDALAACERLEDVELAGNELEEFPAVLARLPRLRNLDLSGNARVTSLPGDETLAQMKALRTLSLTGCRLDEAERARVRAAFGDDCVILF